ncbi:hypothetical protein EVAR_44279_1 [Eumeta japonica]|uniref:Uncharacterized protein n=1 Tax=Eumeta variegata TaxID=151549 RepID=A0A4C1WPG2_EUMVA|nr:hypothetical protein EVAR_44279_1 [Eumeta japonica]
MAQCRSTTRSREALTAKTEHDRERDSAASLAGDCPRASSTSSGLLKRPQNRKPLVTKPKAVKATYKKKTNVERKRISFSVHSNMKTKQVKEDPDRTVDEEAALESSAKTRSRKKAAAEAAEEERSKLAAEADSKVPKKSIRNKVTKTVVRKRPLGIQKTLRNKKIVVVKDKLKKNVIKQTTKRGRRATIKTEPASETEEKDTPALIAVTEIKDELIEEVYPNSRSSSPKTAGRRPRVSSDIAMMKSVLGDSPNTLVLGPRTSPYSMRSERSNSPSIIDNSRRSGRPRKLKTNLLNEVVKNEQKKRRRLLSDSKSGEVVENSDENKKSKRGRSCSRDDSEFSKCSDISESDASLLEPPGADIDREPKKKIDKTDLVVDNELNLQISTDSEKVPSLDAADNTPVLTLDINLSHAPQEKTKKKLSLKRSTSLDSDNNNSNRLKLENLRNSADIDDKSNVSIKTENDTLFSDRSSILTSMSKTFNSKEVSKNIRRARRNIKAAAVRRTSQPPPKVTQSIDNEAGKNETLESISKEINELIQTLEVSDAEPVSEDLVENVVKPDATNQIKSVTKFYNLPEVKPLTDNNSLIIGSETIKDKDTSTSIESTTPSKNDDSENMRLHFEGDEESPEKSTTTKEITYKCAPITASIDKLMDRLKTFEEFDKKRQHELMKSNESKSVMVTNDVVLIPKSGVDVKPLKDLQPVKSPEKPIEKENVLSCFENNSAISIVKRDQVRKSVDIDLPNSVTLIKRNSVSTRKESTGSNHSRESNDAISIFEKSLGKDVTLTEIRKSSDKSTPTTPVELHQFATLHPNNPVTNNRAISLDSSQISIMPRVSTSDGTKQANVVDVQLKRHSRDTLPKLSESGNDTEPEKMATIERIKSPIPVSNQQMKPPITITSLPPVAIKSPEVLQPMETEVLAPPLESVKMIPENMPLTSEVPTTEVKDTHALITKIADAVPNGENSMPALSVQPLTVKLHENIETKADLDEIQNQTDIKTDVDTKLKESYKKPPKSPVKGMRSKRVSSENQPGPSNAFAESPENQRKKENVLRTLGLITHKAAKEARIMKQKEKERMYAKAYGSGLVHKAKTAKTTSNDYTGTLKTVIKLNRSSGEREKGKKYKTSLKMTFQKSKNRNGKPLLDVEAAGADDTYYTIERREGATSSSGAIEGGHRKSHYSNRLNHGVWIDTTSQESTAELSTESGKEATLNLVIPEKASSFSIHPGRLCMDQCFYCGGKFGLFDTPCHIAQMKSTERQKKVLDNEEKLTIDSCLCDACYRHVDRRANCPSYRRNKPAARAPPAVTVHTPAATATTAIADASALEKLSSPPLEEESEEESGTGSGAPVPGAEGRPARCHTAGCLALASHDIPRKWLIKMRPSVNKLLKLELDYPGLHTIPLCGEHHRALAPLMVCVLCQRRITKLHKVHTISQDYEELNPLLSEVGIPVQFTERPVLCKLCRYYCSLLQRPSHNAKHEHAYRRRLLQLYNIEVPPDSEGENNYSISQQNDEILSNSKQKKKAKTKSKQRKSSDLKHEDGTSRDRTSESSPEKILKEESNDFSQRTHQNMEEDIESLISSNKILVPGASKPSSAEPSLQSDNSDAETLVDYDTPLLPIDKQTELQYLLQKQNNPAQFLQKPNANLTQKQKSMLKIHSSIQKPGQQHRIHDKNAKRIHKLGQIVAYKEKPKSDVEMIDIDKPKETVQGISLLKNMALNEECTIETVPNKKPADINMLKNKWQMSESFTQVKKNLSELSKNLSGEKITKKTSDIRYLNPVKRLETNPSISVRELFPGEEEMNLQCNIEFNNVRGVTPEGWEKCNTTIQYDVETKKLWNELQRPYGNQSSFLRHLVLLEKYFRNGDLILAHNATVNAVNYSDSVQSRLKAYDNVTVDAPKRCEPAISLIEFRKQKPTATPIPTNGKSLLKSNQITCDIEKPKSPEGSKKQFLTPTSIPKSKPNKTESKNKTKPLPPELIAINTPNAQGRKAIQNVLHNIQQLVKGVSAADPTEVAAAPLPHQAPRVEQPKKQKTTKPWRPTLMPITQENLARIAREPLQLAVDGRSLPSLVQVMSSGNRYHITLQDYNKMCVMRREKLQQLHDGDSKRRDDTTLITEIQPSAMLGNGGTLKQTIPSTDKFELEKSKDLDLGQIGTNAATILKNVGLKNITIAPIPAKPATVTSHNIATTSASPSSLLIAGAPVKMPQLGPAVSITSESVGSSLPMLTSGPIQITGSMVLPKIPKSLTVIPQMMPTTTVTPIITTPATDKIQSAIVPMTTQVTTATDTTRP